MSTTKDGVDDGETVSPDDSRRWLAFGVVMLAAFMDFLDVSIINTAIPAIQNDIGASNSAAQWIAAGYTLAFAVLLITGGRLGDIFGVRKVFLTGLVGFTVASTLCGLAMSPGMLIAARVAQGAMAAVMIPQVFAFVQTMLRPHERPKAFGIYGAVTALAVVLGGPVGGFLIEANIAGTGWRSIFFLNVPIGIIAIVATLRLVPNRERQAGTRLDLIGVALVTVSLVLLMYPIIQLKEHGWSPIIIGSFVLAALGLTLFVAHQRAKTRGDREPLINTELFRHRPFVIGLLITLVFYAGVNSFFLIYNITFQTGLGYSALTASWIALAWPIGIVISSNIAVKGMRRFGPRLLTIGMTTMALSLGILSLVVSSAESAVPVGTVIPLLFLSGIGMGMVAPTLIDLVLAVVPGTQAGAASGVLNSVLQLGAALGVAVIGIIYFAPIGTAPTAEDFLTGFSQGLWYHFAVFAVGAALTFLLPMPDKDGTDEDSASQSTIHDTSTASQ